MKRAGNTALWHLARLHGIQRVFTDEGGTRRVVPDESLKTVLGLLGVPVTTQQDVRRSLNDTLQKQWTQVVDDTLVVSLSHLETGWTVRIPLGKTSLSKLNIHVDLSDDTGRKKLLCWSPEQLHVEASKILKGVRYVRIKVPFPTHLRPGYFKLNVRAVTQQKSWKGVMTLIVTPQTCFLPPNFARSTRLWGITVQLYGLRSKRNWGIGDFQDLKEFMTWAGGTLEAAMVGVNPLHALAPDQISPYSPSSRLFHNPLYLAVENMADFQENRPLQRRFHTQGFQNYLEQLRTCQTVDYDQVRALKWRCFELSYRHFQRQHLRTKTPRGTAFLSFVREKGEDLERFAQFQVLSERFQHKTGLAKGWRRWPRQFRHPNSPEVRRFCKKKLSRINFYRYLEWQCEIQLSAIQKQARLLGMPIGLYQDLAVGIDPNGSDAWAFQDQLVPGASIGTPPELFSPQGQHWNLVPLAPQRMRKEAYQVFVDTFREMMRYTGLLRIDHAMGLFRLFWIPEGFTPAKGAYMRYPDGDLLGILAIESQQQHVMIVGEDLGTVTPRIHRSLMEAGLLSYRLLLFEKSKTGRFHMPDRYPRQAMVSVTTHDLPTLAGFWSGRDIDWKDKLGLYAQPSLKDHARQSRQKEIRALLLALNKARQLPAGFKIPCDRLPPLTLDLRLAVFRFLARTPSYLLTISLEDLLGDRESPNLPGAPSNEYPVWRRKTGPSESSLESWSHLSELQVLADALNEERGYVRQIRRKAKPKSAFSGRLKKHRG